MLVQDMMFRLTQRIDPYSKAGVALTAATVGTTDGDRFTKEDKLSIYNQARFALAGSIDRNYPDDQKAQTISGTITTAAISFSSGVGAKPAGFIRKISLYSSSGLEIGILKPTSIQRTRSLISATNPFVYDYGTNFNCLDWTSSILPNSASPTPVYTLTYYGITTYVITDVTNGTTTESFNDGWLDIIIQLAEAIANEYGSAEVNALADQLVGKK